CPPPRRPPSSDQPDLRQGKQSHAYGDLNRRTIQIRLDAQCQRPEERRFEFDAIDLALRRRPELVAAALTVERAYLSAG
ncbi:hypothetical protein, partial [Mesorhizobium sp.]|uniref:hypothetical protein n=1 Tax=Mesorhizobium sp. TaxID=1871066 RepID=UPI0025CFC58B